MKLVLLCLACASIRGGWAAEPAAPDYRKQIAPLLNKYCNGCHNAEEANGELILQSYQGMLRGGENGAVIVPGKAEKSRLILMIEKKLEPFMPPEDEKAPSAEEIALLKAWIDAGAKGPVSDLPDPASIVTPNIPPIGKVRRPINAVEASPDGKWIAVARYGIVEILAATDRRPITTLSGHVGQVNDLCCSTDGSQLAVAAGEAGLVGEATIWNTADWSKTQTIRGHHDTMYAAELSPDGKILATGSYDQKIKLFSTATGAELGQLSGHNGAVFDLAFHKDGKLLASASDDRTVKLWDVATRRRLDTLNEPTKGQNAVAISPDGRYLVAGGIDNRIRIWEIRAEGREGTNTLLYSRFAHEAPILELRFTPDGSGLLSSSQDRSIKIWETGEFRQLNAIKDQPDWVSALAVLPDHSKFLAGRLDGTLTSYPLSKPDQAIARPQPLRDGSISPPQNDASAAVELPELAEVEPNDQVEQATPLSVPAVAKGTFLSKQKNGSDTDLFRFDSRAGRTWILETKAAREKSPADTKIEVLHADSRPVQRLLLRAMRDSYITFRPINSIQEQVRLQNWEEMKLTQYLYMAGEVCRLYRAPRGPDSGWAFFMNGGNRRCYFDTSGITHANGAPVYIVEPYAAGTKLVDNGLPVFPINYVNDDDGERELGSDSRLTFTAPADGAYLVRLTEVRGFSGDDYKYSLTIRDPRPDFTVTLGNKGMTIPAGGAKPFSVQLDRIDNFDGDVRVDISGLPPGFHVSSPIVVQAGHLKASGVVLVDQNTEPTKTADDPVRALKPGEENPESQAKIDWSRLRVTAGATIGGKRVDKSVETLGELKVAKQPDYLVRLEPDLPKGADAATGHPHELVIAPGTTITAMLRIERQGFDGELRFDLENLPHGVIVDNIGLSGVLIREGESERQIFLSAGDWVPESSRHVSAVARSQGKLASPPVLFHLRRPAQVAESSTRESKSNR